ncbi:MAG: DNA-binding transcriptional LysR family regulator [Candidatus Endobugula sp.]|jgi:DNA-binding transcriptional LysR family regulator
MLCGCGKRDKKMSLESKSLRYFCAVAGHGSFTAAADSLSIAQPAMSMSIKRLEEELGLRLFNRFDRQISLTDEGQKLYEYARPIVQSLNDAQQAMAELRGLDDGLVRIGMPGMLGSYYFPPLLMAFRHQYPGIKLSIIDAGADQLQAMLEQGELDLAFIVSEDVPDSLGAEAILRLPMVAVVAKEHAFAQLDCVDIEQFLQQELVIFKPGYFHRRIIDQMASESGIAPNISIETNLIHLMKSFVSRGFGITSFLDIVLEDETDLVGVPFAEPFSLNIHIAWRKQGYLSVANRAFRDFIVEHSEQGS